MSIPWEHEVDFFRASGRGSNLTVQRTKMTMLEATKAFAALTPDEQKAAGIGAATPLEVEIAGKPALVGWFSADACRLLVDMLPSEH